MWGATRKVEAWPTVTRFCSVSVQPEAEKQPEVRLKTPEGDGPAGELTLEQEEEDASKGEMQIREAKSKIRDQQESLRQLEIEHKEKVAKQVAILMSKRDEVKGLEGSMKREGDRAGAAL